MWWKNVKVLIAIGVSGVVSHLFCSWSEASNAGSGSLSLRSVYADLSLTHQLLLYIIAASMCGVGLHCYS